MIAGSGGTDAQKAEAEKLFLTAPVQWLDETGKPAVGVGEEGEQGDNGEMTAIGVGSLDGKPRREKMAVLHSLITRVATHASKAESSAVAAATAATITTAVTQNGAPTGEKKLDLPPPPPVAEMERMTTEYKTPYSDPADLKKELAAAAAE